MGRDQGVNAPMTKYRSRGHIYCSGRLSCRSNEFVLRSTPSTKSNTCIDSVAAGGFHKFSTEIWRRLVVYWRLYVCLFVYIFPLYEQTLSCTLVWLLLWKAGSSYIVYCLYRYFACFQQYISSGSNREISIDLPYVCLVSTSIFEWHARSNWKGYLLAVWSWQMTQTV